MTEKECYAGILSFRLEFTDIVFFAQGLFAKYDFLKVRHEFITFSFN